jgi:hypothetical protein
MTVKVTKPALNLREKLSELDKPSGIAGQDILKADTPQEVFNYIGAGRRNLIINGAMQVAQRGTSFSGFTASSAVFPADRMKSNGRSGEIGTWTISQDSDAPSGFGSSVKYLCTTANTSLAANAYMALEQRVEGYNAQPLNDTTGTKAFTVSFWVKSNKTGTYILEVNNQNDARQINKAYTIDSVDTWEYKTINIPADSGYYFDNNNGHSLDLFFWLLAGTNYTTGSLNTSWSSSASGANTRATGVVNLADATNNYWQITGLQLEVGSVATPFEHRSYGEELALCQRYYEVVGNGASALANSSTQFWTGYTFKTEKRANPTVSILPSTLRYFKFGLANRDNSSPNISNAYYGTTSSLILVNGFSSLTANESAMTGGSTTDSSAKMFAFDAEL